MQIAELTPLQQQVYDLLLQQLSPQTISERLNTTSGVVYAQITRMRNKGVKLPGDDGFVGFAQAPTNPFNKAEEFLKKPEAAPLSTGPSSNDGIAAELEKGKPAIDYKELEALAAKLGGKYATETHAMLLLGAAIQFVKLCGGRMSAHQLIEDVYGALRAFVSPQAMPEAEVEIKPLPQSDQERLKFLEEQNQMLLKKLNELQAKQSARFE